MKITEVLHNVTIELLNYCNSSCIHCYLENAPLLKMHIDDCKRVIDEAAEAGAMQITLTGGEALLHPNIEEIIHYIHSQGMAVNLLTSLNIINGDCLEVVATCDKIGVSIYGSNSEVHDGITQDPGSFERMMKNLRYLVTSSAIITLNITVMRENIDDLQNIVSIANDLALSYRVNYVLHGAQQAKHQICITEVHNINKVCGYEEKAENTTNFICVAGRSSLWVEVNLDVYPCVFFRLLLGNLNKTNLKTLWKESTALKSIKEIKTSDFAKCNKCKLKYVCTPCVGENYNASGKITEPSDFSCRIGAYQSHVSLIRPYT